MDNFFAPTNTTMTMRAVGRTFRRGIFVPRSGGLRKDAAQVMRTAQGHSHGASEANLQHVKGFLADKYAIPDDMALQVLTHKLFANGIKPYNEKLGAMGAKLLNLYLAKHVVAAPTANDTAIAGKNLDVLGTPMAKELGGRLAAGVFAQKQKLNPVMFWTSYNHLLSFEQSGELRVSAQLLYALVGAVTFTHGKARAEEFVREKLLLGPDSLESIAAEFLQRT